jgi:hypothetical protein
MKESDQLATFFVTPFGSYYYVMMSFGLKNTRATYQRCMIKCFSRTIEVYVDDIVVKTRRSEGLIHDLRETFDMLKYDGIKLNLQKCAFDVPGGMLLGFLVFKRGMEANLEKFQPSQIWGPYRISRESSELWVPSLP